MKLRLILILFSFSFNFCFSQQIGLNKHAVCFYYNWYGSKQLDGKNHHWAHPVMPQNDMDTTTASFVGNGNIGANFYPEKGEYSSADTAIILLHMQELASAGIGVIAVTWLGEDDYTFASVPLILNAANRYGIKVCFQIEPRVRKTVYTVRDAIIFLIDHFGNHPAFYREEQTKKPMFFVYDSYVIPAREWKDVLGENGRKTIRKTKYDSDMIGLWCWKEDSAFFLNSGFDGFYTYFASRGFTYGSTPENWPYLQQWSEKHHLLFIPSVGPGYIDDRIRPWNKKNTKSREQGKYYDDWFDLALKSKIKWIGITSFNEWHEGTQLEPAQPQQFLDYKYEDYQPLAPNYYLRRTKYWLDRLK